MRVPFCQYFDKFSHFCFNLTEILSLKGQFSSKLYDFLNV